MVQDLRVRQNDNCPNGIRLHLVPEINSVNSPKTRQNVSCLRVRQDNFQQTIERCVAWDIEALDFVNPRLDCSLRDLAMKIESRTIVTQPLFHSVDKTWNQSGCQFGFFLNVDTEAQSMIVSLIPFLRHHCQESVVKWFSSTAQQRALRAKWDVDEGHVKTPDDTAVSWMMTEAASASFDAPPIAAQEEVTCPDPSNLQVIAGLIKDHDSVDAFDPQGAAAVACTGVPAQLIMGSKAEPSSPGSTSWNRLSQ